jgi:pimeloyl-ACP methyl ester carboxylesterase
MPTATVNGVRLFYRLAGDAGPPLALVHGSWGSSEGWAPVVPTLSQHFRVLAYDRRGHGQSERPPGQGSAEEDAADLAALIDHLELAPAHVAGISFGGSISLRLAARRPEVVRSVAAQEPPLFDLLAADPVHRPVMREVHARMEAVVAALAAGDAEGGSRQFMDTVAFGPGTWDLMSPEERQWCVDISPTFLDETRDPEAYTVDLSALAAFPRPILLTYGDQSPACFPPVIALLANALPRATVQVFTGAGHVPLDTHPTEYAVALTALVKAADAGLD